MIFFYSFQRQILNCVSNMLLSKSQSRSGVWNIKNYSKLWSEVDFRAYTGMHIKPPPELQFNALCPWTNDPLGQMVRSKFGPHGQMVPQNLDPWTNGPCISWSLQSVPPDKWNILGTIFLGEPNWLGTICSWGLNFFGTICPLGPNWLRTVCPEGPINWGPIVGDQMCHSQ